LGNSSFLPAARAVAVIGPDTMVTGARAVHDGHERHNDTRRRYQQDKPHQQEGYRTGAFRRSVHRLSNVIRPAPSQSVQSPIVFPVPAINITTPVLPPSHPGQSTIGRTEMTSAAKPIKSTPPTRKLIPRPEGRESWSFIGVLDPGGLALISVLEVGRIDPIAIWFLFRRIHRRIAPQTSGHRSNNLSHGNLGTFGGVSAQERVGLQELRLQRASSTSCGTISILQPFNLTGSLPDPCILRRGEDSYSFRHGYS
jgi:hypothetical protein